MRAAPRGALAELAGQLPLCRRVVRDVDEAAADQPADLGADHAIDDLAERVAEEPRSEALLKHRVDWLGELEGDADSVWWLGHGCRVPLVGP
ncbi:MAG: hypothetical protein DRH08_00065 [Deltaproteobacteria bacterium]|nr:MAG: hypothetical protein DRH08_00065 [Deltaproteobacteria bacterium]